MTDHLRKKIAVFREENAAAGSVIDSLQRSFHNTSIKLVTSHDVKHNTETLNEHTLAFVLPGIIGEHSPYNALLGREGNSRIRNYVENGGVFVGFCAGAYYACENIMYQNPCGVSKSQRPGLDFFKATAQGPLPNKGRKSEEGLRWSSTTMVQIEYKNEYDKQQNAGIRYGNGPYLTNIRDQNIEIIARYSQVPGKPVAMASRNIGKGLALFIGVHPETSIEHINQEWVSKGQPHLERLIREATPHEHERKQFWNYIVNTIKRHNINLGRAQESVLRQRP